MVDDGRRRCLVVELGRQDRHGILAAGDGLGDLRHQLEGSIGEVLEHVGRIATCTFKEVVQRRQPGGLGLQLRKVSASYQGFEVAESNSYNFKHTKSASILIGHSGHSSFRPSIWGFALHSGEILTLVASKNAICISVERHAASLAPRLRAESSSGKAIIIAGYRNKFCRKGRTIVKVKLTSPATVTVTLDRTIV